MYQPYTIRYAPCTVRFFFFMEGDRHQKPLMDMDQVPKHWTRDCEKTAIKRLFVDAQEKAI